MNMLQGKNITSLGSFFSGSSSLILELYTVISGRVTAKLAVEHHIIVSYSYETRRLPCAGVPDSSILLLIKIQLEISNAKLENRVITLTPTGQSGARDSADLAPENPGRNGIT